MTQNFSPTLFRWLLRPLLPMNFVLVIAAVLWAALYRLPMHAFQLVPALLIAGHAVLCASFLYWGWNGTAGFGFLQSRGFSARQLWAHRLVAAVASALMVWGAIAIVTWTPLRGWLQGEFFQNPLYPFMAWRDALTTLQWLGLYLLFISAAHYAWIRQAQPTRYPGAGHALLFALPAWIAVLALFPDGVTQHSVGYLFFTGMLTFILSLLLFIAGYRLSKTLELSLS